VWRATDLLQAGDMTIRQGDSLLLTVGQTIGGIMNITVNGVSNDSGTTSQPIAHRFNEAGTFTVTGTVADANGVSQSRNITVKVVGASFNGSPDAWAGKTRVWDCRNLPAVAVIEADSRLKCQFVNTLTNGGRQFALTTDAAELRYVIARLGSNGPILANCAVQGFRLFSANETEFGVLQTYPDGSQLIEMGLVLGPVLPDIIVRITIFVGGVTFDDGTVIKNLTQADFNALGETHVRFLRPGSARTSACHVTRAYQSNAWVGQY